MILISFVLAAMFTTAYASAKNYRPAIDTTFAKNKLYIHNTLKEVKYLIEQLPNEEQLNFVQEYNKLFVRCHPSTAVLYAFSITRCVNKVDALYNYLIEK